MNTSLTPQFFDALVIAVIILGLFVAAFRIYGDFKKGPIWPEDDATGTPKPSTASQSNNTSNTLSKKATKQQEAKEKKS